MKKLKSWEGFCGRRRRRRWESRVRWGVEFHGIIEEREMDKEKNKRKEKREE